MLTDEEIRSALERRSSQGGSNPPPVEDLLARPRHQQPPVERRSARWLLPATVAAAVLVAALAVSLLGRDGEPTTRLENVPSVSAPEPDADALPAGGGQDTVEGDESVSNSAATFTVPVPDFGGLVRAQDAGPVGTDPAFEAVRFVRPGTIEGSFASSLSIARSRADERATTGDIAATIDTALPEWLEIAGTEVAYWQSSDVVPATDEEPARTAGLYLYVRGGFIVQVTSDQLQRSDVEQYIATLLAS